MPHATWQKAKALSSPSRLGRNSDTAQALARTLFSSRTGRWMASLMVVPSGWPHQLMRSLPWFLITPVCGLTMPGMVMPTPISRFHSAGWRFSSVFKMRSSWRTMAS